MRPIRKIIIHCADTPASMDIGASEIRDWHVNGNGWKDIGYHFVIRRNGIIETGRPVHEIGAHAAGYNEDSIGVCMVGGKPDCNFTFRQWDALYRQVATLTRNYPEAEVIGHNDVSSKACPTFDAKAWWAAQ